MYYSQAPRVAITTTNNKTHLLALNTGTFTVRFLTELQQYYVDPGLLVLLSSSFLHMIAASRNEALRLGNGYCNQWQQEWVLLVLGEQKVK